MKFKHSKLLCGNDLRLNRMVDKQVLFGGLSNVC